MVINEYTGELSENTVDLQTDLRSLTAPVLSIRDNDYVIPHGGVLTLHYHVCDYYGPEYPNLDGTVTVGKQGVNTFTFVARIDEDVLDLGDVPEFKQTTLSGEQVIELDVSDLCSGVHSILVQAISNGVASPVEWLKFRIKDENEAIVKTLDEPFVLPGNILDLSGVQNGFYFRSSYVGSITSTYIDADTGENIEVIDNSSSKIIKENGYRPYGNENGIFKRVIVADYKVTKNSETEIQIDVAEGSRIYYTNINQWTGYSRYADTGNLSYAGGYGPAVYNRNGLSYEDISGSYKLTNTVVDGTTVYTLADHLKDAPESIPNIVLNGAIKNKFALTRLCEAVQALFYGNQKTAGVCGVKLPQSMDIVIDYHGFGYTLYPNSDTPEYYKANETPSINTRFVEYSHIKFPDRFTLDLNGSAISCLQVNDFANGMMLVLIDCYDTHIVNGKIQGGYKYRKYNGSFAAGYRLAESLGNIMICGSEFCSFEHIDNCWSVGYDAECVGRNVLGLGDRFNSSIYNRIWILPFNQPGYIDFEGKKHTITDVDDFDIVPRYTEGLNDPSGYTTGKYISYSSLMHKIINTGTSTNPVYAYRGRKSFNSNPIYLRGCHNIITHTGDTISGDDAFAYGVSMYIYFYKKLDPNSAHFQQYLVDKANNGGAEPDYEPLEFIKAYKISASKPFLVPKDAEYAHLCVTGSYVVNPWVGLKHKERDDYFARLQFNEYQSSWCSGFKDCWFHDSRTSILNFHYSYQCYLKGCNVSGLGSGRSGLYGGMSNQTNNIDVEDNSAFAGNMVISDVETVFGSVDAKFHHPINLICDKIRNYFLILEKNVFKGIVKDSYVSVTNRIGYSHPIKFMRFVNSMFSKVTVSSDGRGSGNRAMYIEDSSVDNTMFANANKASIVQRNGASVTTTTNE